MRSSIKKVLVLLLCAMMLVSFVPTEIFAEDIELLTPETVVGVPEFDFSFFQEETEVIVTQQETADTGVSGENASNDVWAGNEYTAQDSGHFEAGTEEETDSIIMDESNNSSGNTVEEPNSDIFDAADNSDGLEVNAEGENGQKTANIKTPNAVEEGFYCGLAGHTHSVECYSDDGSLICGITEHVHTLACLSNPNADVENDAYWYSAFADFPKSGNLAEDVIAVARTQIGYSESVLNFTVQEDGVTRNGYTRYGHVFGMPYEKWDAMFCSFCLFFGGAYGVMPVELSCSNWVEVLRSPEYDLFRDASAYIPSAGDLVFFADGFGSAGHVGFVSELICDDAENITGFMTIEGDVGNCVYCGSYDVNDGNIFGYGMLPKNQTVADAEEIAVEIITIESLPASDGAVAVITGNIPEGARAVIETVSYTEEDLIALFGEEAAAMSSCDAYDIKIMVGEEEWQPDSEVSVIVKRPGFMVDEDEELTVTHIDSVTGEKSVVDSLVNENGEIRFVAEGFSTYFLSKSQKLGSSLGDNEASINGTEYKTLAEALGAAASGDTITLLKDVTVNWSSAYVLSKSITLDGDGHNLELSGEGFNMSNSTFNLTNAQVTAAGSFVNNLSRGTLNLSDCSVEAAASIVFGSASGTVINATGCTLNSGSICFENCLSNVVVSSCNIEAVKNFVDNTYKQGANVTVSVTNGSTITCATGINLKGDTGTITISDSSLTTTSVGIYSYYRTDTRGGNVTVNITNSSINSGSYCIYTDIRDKATSVTLTNSALISNSTGVYLNCSRRNTLNMSGGSIKSNTTGVYGYNTEVRMDGCTVEAGKTAISTATYSDIFITSGSYKGNPCIDSIGGVTISGGTFVSDSDSCIEAMNPDGTISGGTFICNSEKSYDNCITYENHNYDWEISGGDFIRNGNNGGYVLNVTGTGSKPTLLSGGTFTNNTGAAALCIHDISIVQGKRADPIDYKETQASYVRIIPNVITVNFYSERALYYSVTDDLSLISFPKPPIHSAGYGFVDWIDKDGKHISASSDLSGDADLYARFSDSAVKVYFDDRGEVTEKDVPAGTVLGNVEGMDRTSDGDYFYGWMLDDDYVDETSTLTLYDDLSVNAIYNIVYTYPELQEAVSNRCETIYLGDHITVEGPVNITYDCTVDGLNHTLSRAATYTNGRLINFSGDSFSLLNTNIDGKNISSSSGAVYVDSAENVTVSNCSFKNNATDADGAALRLEYCGDVNISGSEFTENTAEYGGGVYIDRTDCTNMENCIVSGNTASKSGGGIYLTEWQSILNLKHTTVSGNIAANDGGGIYAFNSVINLFETTRISGNTAGRDGGGIDGNDEVRISMYESSLVDNNIAGANGGGIRIGGTYELNQYGGTIRDNTAGVCGGGIYSTAHIEHALFMEGGMVFDNVVLSDRNKASDVYFNATSGVYNTQPNRIYGDGNSKELATVVVKPIDGYANEPAAADNISVPYDSWYDDDDVPFENRQTGTKTEELSSGSIKQYIRAVWYGLVLAYDANYDGGGYCYDNLAYAENSEAEVKSFMLTAPAGKLFVGWNTKADGSGTAYSANDPLLMDDSKVLYAQYEDLYTVVYKFEGDVPSDAVLPTDTNYYKWHDSVDVADPPTTSETSKDGESGVWSFLGWEADEYLTKDGIEGNVTITGKWKFIPYNVTVQFSGVKTLTGRTLATEEFSFTLAGIGNDVSETVKNDAAGNFSFSPLTYSVPGTYTYKIYENEGTLPGVSYDKTVYYVTVNVEHGDTGTLTATIKDTYSGTTLTSDEFYFSNSYEAEPATLTFSGKKTLIGRPITDQEFSFTITGAGDGVNETVKNSADGSISFSPITYTVPGTYTYTVKEEAVNEPGIVSDDKTYDITVTVTDSGSGQLTAEISGDTSTGKDLNFINRYGTEPVSVAFSGTKTLTGRTLAADEFSFTITGAQDSVSETVKNSADGKISFTEITYTEPGVYTYTVKEEATNALGVTTDSKVYNITVTVTDNGRGRLLAAITGDTTTGRDLNFHNVFSCGSLSISKVVTGNLGDRTKYFPFTVTFNVSGEYNFSGSSEGKISSGGTVMLKHGDKIVISGLPAGTVYKVTESKNYGYAVYSTDSTGVIMPNGFSKASFTNTLSTVPRTGDNGNLNGWLGFTTICFSCLIGTLLTGKGKRRNTGKHLKKV